MYSRFSWEWKAENVGPALGRSIDVDRRADMETVSVRRGGSCDPILIPLENGRKVKVTGPPGCGKSSSFVSMVAIESRRPVVHLVPHPRLVSDFVRRGYGRCAVYTDLGCVLNTPCVLKCPAVVVATYTQFFAETLSIGKSIHDVTRRPIFYCDECHESDAATFSIVRMFMSREDTHSAVFVSATLDGDEAALEVSDPINDVIVPRISRSAEFGKVISENLAAKDDPGLVVIYCDSGYYDLKVLQSAVESAGYLWFRMTARSSQSEYDAAKFASRSERTVFCLDSSYRSGFDLPVSMVIDSSLVTYRSSRDPNRYSVRDAFGFELYQARGRLGRDVKTRSYDLKYVRIGSDPKDHIANIEGYEGILASHLFRSQGITNPRELFGTGLDGVGGFLPDYRCIDSDIHLTPTMLMSLAEIELSRKRESLNDGDDTSSEYGDPLAGFNALRLGKPEPIKVPDAIGKTMLSVSGAVEDTSIGTQTFPLGKDSVIACLEKKGLSSVLPYMSRKDIFLVSGVLAEEMNNLSCEFLAADALVKYVAREPEGARSSSQTKWLRDVHTSLGMKASKFSARARDLQVLVDLSNVDFALIEPREFKDVISTIASTGISLYKSQKSTWLPNDTIVGTTRNLMFTGYSLNAGFDSIGNRLQTADPIKNETRLLKNSGEVVKPNVRRLGSINDSASHPKLTLCNKVAGNSKPSNAIVNAVTSPILQEYEERRRRSETGDSSSKGSWTKNKPDGSGLFKTSAKTWHPPG